MRDLLLLVFGDRQLRPFEHWLAYAAQRPLRGLSFLDALEKMALLVLAFFQCVGLLLFDTPITPYGDPIDRSGYELVFEDTFEGGVLDLEKWEYRGSGARAGGFMAPDQVRVEDGKLILRAEYRADGPGGAGWYSGIIRTKEEFIGGIFEVSAVVSEGGGFWSAFWLNAPGMASAEASNGGPGGAEIDIFEAGAYGKSFLTRNSVAFNVHVGGYGDGLRSAGPEAYYGKNIYKEYNTYTLKWTAEEYIFYINGVEATRSSFQDGVSRAEEYIILSLELPDAEGFTEQPGFTAEFLVDCVRVWQEAD